MIDPENPVVRLVMQSNEAEVAGDRERQRALLREAWAAATTPYERAVAAHYIARIQPTPAGSHHWNRDALDQARAALPEAVRALMPSLHLAFGESLERVGSLDRAAEAYRDAMEAASGLPAAEGYVRAAQDGLGRVEERA